MGRYCSCSGAAACPVTTPLEMRKNSWIPSPQMFQKLTWPKTRRHLGHVVRFVRFIPATTATISSMEPFVCKTEKSTEMSEPYGPWRFRWAITGGLMVENTGARPIQSLRNFTWFEENFLKWFSCQDANDLLIMDDHHVFFLFADFFQFSRMFATHQSSIRKHISHQGGKTAICTVMACTYTFQLALTRCQKFAKSLRFGGFRLNLSPDFVRKMTLLPALHGLLDERQVCIWCRGAGRGQEWRWMVEVHFIMLFLICC